MCVLNNSPHCVMFLFTADHRYMVLDPSLASRFHISFSSCLKLITVTWSSIPPWHPAFTFHLVLVYRWSPLHGPRYLLGIPLSHFIYSWDQCPVPTASPVSLLALWMAHTSIVGKPPHQNSPCLKSCILSIG